MNFFLFNKLFIFSLGIFYYWFESIINLIIIIIVTVVLNNIEFLIDVIRLVINLYFLNETYRIHLQNHHQSLPDIGRYRFICII